MMNKLISTAAVALLAWSVRAAEQPKDTVFRALEDELGRSMSLRLEGLDEPYFIQYEVSDATTYRISAAFGALLNSDENRSRLLVSQVRVGSYALDNSNFTGPRAGGRSGLGASAALPTDDDYYAIRHAIWRTTDWQFKEALETLTRKRAYLKDRVSDERPADFTKAPLTNSIQPLAVLAFERPTWENYARQISACFREFPQIQDADVFLVTGLQNRRVLNSEGLRLRDGLTETLLRVTANAQAEDGERIADVLSYYAPAPDQLPPLSEVLADARSLAERLTRVAQAPVLDDYSGPVLFDGLAAPQLFRQLLGAGVTGSPDAVGTARRSAQASDDLDNRVGKRILPQTFQVYDDPRQAKVGKFYLAGHYQIDDEGIPAQRVDVVVDGKLEGLVMSRTPTKRFAASNGHGRRGGSEVPRSAVGCLYVESSKALTPEELKKELLDAADAEGLKFGLRVTGVQSRAGGPSGGSGRFRRGGGGGGRMVGDPIGVYKVYVSDGHEELVRGCEFTSLNLQSLRKILAAGNNPSVQNLVIGTTPSSSLIVPPLLVGEVELSGIKAEGEKKTILAAPHARRKPAAQ